MTEFSDERRLAASPAAPGDVTKAPAKVPAKTKAGRTRSLMLLRHAKSDWQDAALDDHDRPLAPRGLMAAAQMGYHLRANRIAVPELVLCSTARRARDTLAILLAAWGQRARTRFLKSLYLCGGEGVMRRVHAVPDSVHSLLIVGHNPDLHEFACGIASTGGAAALDGLRDNFATGALARLDVGKASWSQLVTGGALLAFTRPRDLD